VPSSQALPGYLITEPPSQTICVRSRVIGVLAVWIQNQKKTKIVHASWTGTLWGVWVGGWFSSRLYYPFGKGPGQRIIRCLKNKKCENERTNMCVLFF